MLNKYMNYMAYIMFWRNFKEMENVFHGSMNIAESEIAYIVWSQLLH